MDEEYELTFSEDDVEYYIVDEDDIEVGVALRGEDGQVTEYYYGGDDVEYEAVEDAEDEEEAEEEEAPKKSSSKKSSSSKIGDGPLVTRKGVQAATDDANAIFKDGVSFANEIKGMCDDLSSALDFGDAFDFLKPMKKRH